MRHALVLLVACALIGSAVARGADSIVVTAQLLDYERGYVFFTTGDGFRVAPNAAVVDFKTGAPLARPPRARDYARATFDPAGTVIKLEISRTKLEPQGDLASVHRFAVALSSPVPNPDLGPHTPNPANPCPNVVPGKRVLFVVTVQVPPTTPLTDTVYMTTDQSGWNAQAYRMDRVDTLHYRLQLRLLSGTVLRVLFDRGSIQSVQAGQNGIEAAPTLRCMTDQDEQLWSPTVYAWADQQTNAVAPIPQAMPTLYNPAPFPNLPQPPHTAAPNEAR